MAESTPSSGLQVLFSVLGGGTLDGASGKQIKKELDAIVKAINQEKSLNVVIGLDGESSKKKNWTTQLQEKLDRLSESNRLTVSVSNIKLSTGAISSFKKQLSDVINTLDISKGTTVTLNAEGIGEIKSKLKEVGDAGDESMSRMSEKTAEVKGQMKALAVASGAVATAVKGVMGGKIDSGDLAEVMDMQTRYLEMVEDFNASNGEGGAERVRQIQAEAAAITQKVAELKKEFSAEQDLEKIAARQKSQINSLQRSVNTALGFTSARGTDEYKVLQQVASELQLIEAGLKKVDDNDLMNLRAALNDSVAKIRGMGLASKSLGDTLASGAKKFASWLGTSQIIMTAVNWLRKMVQTVWDIDTAMTELRKVTDETDATYTRFLDGAVERARRLGATVSDTTTASADFARLGFSLDDAADLADAALVYKNVGDGIEDISAASESIISTMQAFGIEAENAMLIVDKFNTTGNRFAISSGGVGDALMRSASALAAGGNTLDESIGLITAANEVIQSPEVVGTTLKTISMYLRAAKTELEAAGESTDGMASSVSELRGEILRLTGNKVDIQVDDDTFKSTTQILRELSGVWGELSDITQANIMEQIGGKRNANVIAALLNNFETVEEVIASAADAAGSALAENEKYLDSISGKVAKFQSSFEELAISVVNSDIVKVVVDIGTGLMDVLNILQDIQLLIPAIVAGFTALSTSKKMNEAADGIASLMMGFTDDVFEQRVGDNPKALDDLIELFGGLTAAKQKDVLASVAAQAENKKLGTTMITSAVGAGKAKTAFQSLGTTIGAVFSSNWVAWIGVALTLIPALIQLSDELGKTLEERIADNIDKLNAEYAELESTISGVSREFSSLKQSFDDVVPRFAELAQGVDKFGNNLSLSEDEYEEFWQLNNRIAELFPELDHGLDSNGNSMLDLAYDADTLTSSLQALLEAEAALANQEIAGTMPELVGNITAANKEYGKSSDALKADLEEYRKVYESIKDQSIAPITQMGATGTGRSDVQALRRRAEDLGLNLNWVPEASAYEWDFGSLSAEQLDANFAMLEAKYDKLIEDTEKKIEASWNRLNPVITGWLKTDIFYQELDEQMQDVVQILVNGLDFGDLAERGYSTSEDIQDYISDFIITPLTQAEPSVKKAFESILDWRASLKSGEMSSEVFAKKVRQAFDSLLQGMDDGKRADFVQAFVTGLNNAGIAGGDFSTALNGLIAEWSKVPEVANASGESTYSAAEAMKSLADEVKSLKSAYDLLNTAQNEMAVGGLSSDTVASLMEADPEHYLDYLYEENGIIKLNTELWRENARAKMLGDMAAAEAQIAKQMSEQAELEKQISDLRVWMIRNRDVDNSGAAHRHLSELTSLYEENSASIAENQRLLAIYNTLYGDITGEMTAYTEAVSYLDTVMYSINDATGKLQTLAEIQAEVANGFVMSLEKALEFAEVYPQILNGAQVAANGQIQLNEDVVSALISGEQAAVDAAIDAEVKKLQAARLTNVQKLELAKAQLEVVKSMTKSESEVDRQAAMDKIEKSNEVAEALIQNGIDEADAYLVATRSMSANVQEFEKIAREVCRNTDGNFNQMAYNAAMAVYDSMENAKKNTVSLGQQVQQVVRGDVGLIKGNEPTMVSLGDGGSYTGGAVRYTPQLRSPGTYTGSSSGFSGTTAEYTYSAVDADLKALELRLEEDIATYEDAVAQIDGQIAALLALKDKPLDAFKDGSGSGGGGGSGADEAIREVEEYLATIEKYREALERLRDIRIRKADLELKLSNSDDLDEQIALEKQLLDVYQGEQKVLQEINALRDETIAEGVQKLEGMGFVIQYNPDDNKFFVENLEHLNELAADSAGEYETLQEATNALRQDTEGLIDTLEDLNTQNQEDKDAWQELHHAIREAKINIVNDLKEIVQQASEAVDSIQNVYDTLKAAADEYAANDGFISVDAFQAIVDLGPEYMQYLRDENGLLIINEECINRVIAAKTEQLALESAQSYVERLKLALQQDSVESLNTLLYATQEATDATWGLIYADLALMKQMGDLDDSQYSAALHNINAIRSLANTAIHGIGQVAGNVQTELQDMKSGLDDILKYVMDMLRHRIQQQIDALGELKEAYSDLIALKKESLDASKEETDYQDEVADKVKEIAKLQEQINALSLDDSRDAQAQKVKLQEEMAELQEELADTQAEYSVDAQKDSLDKMEEAYHEEKDREIEILEESISSEEKLYRMAIDYIKSNWATLYDELIAWNTEYGSVLNKEISEAWANCLAAAQRYGSYVAALEHIDADIEAAGSGGSSGTSNNNVVGQTTNDSSYSKDEEIRSIVKRMKENSAAWFSATEEERKALDDDQMKLAEKLRELGVDVYRDNKAGVWYLKDGRRLYDVYHQGGVVGGIGTLKENELLAKLEKGEVMVSNQGKGSLFDLIDFVDKLTRRVDLSAIGEGIDIPKVDGLPDLAGVTNRNETIHFGDVYIYGANEETAAKHREINREFTNEVLKQLNIKR